MGMGKRKQVAEIEEGKNFKWKGDIYKVMVHQDDNTIVRRMQMDGQWGHEENFNPCAYTDWGDGA
jgi:hypothetical protein